MNWTRLIQTGGLREIRAALREGSPRLGRDSAGYPLLHHAAMREDSSFRICAWLLDAGADPNERDGARFEQTALHLAAERGNIELAERLLEAGAEPDPPDKWGNGPVWKALHFGGLEINTPRRARFGRLVRLLVEAGADLDRVNDSGRTPRASHLAQSLWAELADL
ncbi:MAG TPA: ankyrin repeat domain-containing protein [Myxococcota bacterium]|nr:ankyrin repeat domain-containing protein [Myxococcota bacterium]